MCKSLESVAKIAYELQILRKIQLIRNQSFVNCRVTQQPVTNGALSLHR